LEILKANEELAGRALRTLGIAYRDLSADALAHDEVNERVERDLVFAGLVGMIDPPRDEAREAVARAKTAGIRPMMITGDHPTTAAVIARDLGIAIDARGSPVATSSEPGTTPWRKSSGTCRSMRGSILNTSCGS
jgi:Ca2+-transporting ATPase